MHISSLYRYPVKGLSPEQLSTVNVLAGEGFPLDRKYALLRTNAEFDPATPAWLAKANFLMLMMHEKLATLKTRYVEHGNKLIITTVEGKEHQFKLDERDDCAALESFFQRFMPKQLPQAPKLLTAEGHMFTDKATKFVSLINLASVRELEKRWGEDLDPLRFRANIYIDGAEPFSELEWVGRRLQIGDVITNVAQRNGRCAATNVNPHTGERDRNVPGKLRADFGHKDLGIYLTIANNGVLHEGDSLSIGQVTKQQDSPQTVTDASDKSLMCSACYYLFDPRTLNADWTSASDIDHAWRCPDCGANRDSVRAID